MTKPVFFVVMLAAIASQVGATDCGQVLRDPGFDLWCGDSLCAWTVERGTVLRVPTWHDADSGVSLGDNSAIAQLAPVNSLDGDCITFDLVANIDNDAEVYLNVDVEGDGKLEMHERLPSSAWKPLSYSIALTAPYDGIRFELTKLGGNAVLAQIGASTSTSCDGVSKLDPGPRPNGGACGSPTDCASGLCVAGPPPVGSFSGLQCGGCDPAQPCADPTDVCGLGVAMAPILAVPLACVPKASVELGARCFVAAECASGICNQGVCSSCDTTTTCPAGETCNVSWPNPPQPFTLPGPSVCGGDQFNAAPGAPCGSDDDCRSQHCIGTARSQCSDGRPCLTSAQCPVDNTLTSGECAIVGVQGGSCE